MIQASIQSKKLLLFIRGYLRKQLRTAFRISVRSDAKGVFALIWGAVNHFKSIKLITKISQLTGCMQQFSAHGNDSALNSWAPKQRHGEWLLEASMRWFFEKLISWVPLKTTVSVSIFGNIVWKVPGKGEETHSRAQTRQTRAMRMWEQFSVSNL